MAKNSKKQVWILYPSTLDTHGLIGVSELVDKETGQGHYLSHINGWVAAGYTITVRAATRAEVRAKEAECAELANDYAWKATK